MSVKRPNSKVLPNFGVENIDRPQRSVKGIDQYIKNHVVVHASIHASCTSCNLCSWHRQKSIPATYAYAGVLLNALTILFCLTLFCLPVWNQPKIFLQSKGPFSKVKRLARLKDQNILPPPKRS